MDGRILKQAIHYCLDVCETEPRKVPTQLIKQGPPHIERIHFTIRSIGSSFQILNYARKERVG